MSTHIICFCEKILCGYPLLSVAMYGEIIIIWIGKNNTTPYLMLCVSIDNQTVGSILVLSN